MSSKVVRRTVRESRLHAPHPRAANARLGRSAKPRPVLDQIADKGPIAAPHTAREPAGRSQPQKSASPTAFALPIHVVRHKSPTFHSSMVAVGRPHTHANRVRNRTAFESQLLGLKKIHQGKERDIYDVGCRASAHRHDRSPVRLSKSCCGSHPFQGEVLTQISLSGLRRPTHGGQSSLALKVEDVVADAGSARNWPVAPWW